MTPGSDRQKGGRAFIDPRARFARFARLERDHRDSGYVPLLKVGISGDKGRVKKSARRIKELSKRRLLAAQTISNAGFGRNQARSGGIVLEFGPQLLGIDPKIMEFILVLRPPNFTQDLGVGEHLAQVAG